MGDAMPGSGKISAANDSMQPDGAPEEKPKAKPMLPPLKISRNGKAIETLYLSTLSRMPTEAEMLRHLHHVQSYHGKDDHNPMTDVLWALLNSMEFRCNH